MNLTELLGAAPPRDDLLVHAGLRLSTGDVENRTERVGAGLAARGIGRGDRVAFQLPVGIDAVVLYRACWRLGATAVALHPRAGPGQLDPAIDRTGPDLLVAEPGTPLHDHRSTLVPGDLDGDTAPADETTESDDAVVLFTSGSSGSPKGVVHTHGSLAYKVAQSIDVHGLTTDDTVLMPAPLAHVSGLLHGVLVPGAAGMKAVLMSKWDAGLALDLIERERVTYMVGPPTFFMGLMDHPDFGPARTESLRMLSCGGAGVTPEFATRARSELGAVVKRSYGSTEAPTVATSRFDDPAERMIGTDGRSFGDTRLRVDDDGELWVSGPELARGYLDPEQTAAAFVDGWFRTGDLATIDDGWLTITGRLDDRIIRGGENISAAEVEHHLEAHPRVRAAVAVAEPDDRLGERVAAFVVAPGGFDLETCRGWFAERGVARFMIPEHIVLVGSLPLLPSGKPDRAALRERVEGATP